jgi:hypothetical protein
MRRACRSEDFAHQADERVMHELLRFTCPFRARRTFKMASSFLKRPLDLGNEVLANGKVSVFS